MKLYAGMALPLILSGAAAFAQDPQATTANGAMRTQGADSTDALFVRKLAQGDLAEVDEGRLASQRATDPAVKRFGEQMVKDHSKNSTELQALAQQKGIAVPDSSDPQQAAARAKLAGASNATFDREYVTAQVQDHEKTVQLLEHQIHSGQDDAVKAFAEKTLPVVSHHLAMAKDLESKLPKTVAGRSDQ